MSTAPRIYVASLADYNAGSPHGVWIDATQDAETIRDEVNTMLRKSMCLSVLVPCPMCDGIGPSDCTLCDNRREVPSAEEWAIFDYEGFYDIRLDEAEPFETVSTLARLVVEYGEPFAAWWENGSAVDATSLEEDFQDAYAGTFDSVEDWAEEFLEGTGALWEVPESLRPYIDFAAWARDAQYTDIWTAETEDGVAIFWNR